MATEAQIEDQISRLLWLGVFAAGGLSLFGMMLFLMSPPFSAAYAMGDSAILGGVALLLLTPAARVVLLLFHYVRLRDYDFVLITVFVLAMMVLGYFMGAG